jgi:hypothetical protein
LAQYFGILAQVHYFWRGFSNFGAGPFFGGLPAPQITIVRSTVAQVLPLLSDLRQKKQTCAKGREILFSWLIGFFSENT